MKSAFCRQYPITIKLRKVNTPKRKNEKLWFVASVSTTKNFEDKFGCSGELYDNYMKKPEKSVSEIEKEEKTKKQ
ncbi:DUF1433 domain-containing protein [Bacillus bingmayongensis]|nr:DUF1433 domain-containing protein [Bacillus bingmayongensis]